MARTVRAEVIDESQVGVYHCVNRCVRRAFLCGRDPLTGQCFDHRKAAIQRRLELLAGQFGIDVLGFSVMSNHVHVVLRNRPDVVAGWSDEEVARRWWNLFPLRRDETGRPAEPEAHELSLLCSSAAAVRERFTRAWKRADITLTSSRIITDDRPSRPRTETPSAALPTGVTLSSGAR